jgi:hypothetical protein
MPIQKWKHIKKKVGICFLAYSTSRVEGRAGAPRWGLGQMTSRSITHINLHKPNNKLVNAWLEHFWCIDKPWAYTDSQDSPRLRLGGSHHLPLIVFFLLGHRTYTQVGNPKILEIGTPTTLEAHNPFFRPSIKVRFEVKL